MSLFRQHVAEIPAIQKNSSKQKKMRFKKPLRFLRAEPRKDDLDGMNVTELKKFASKHGIKGYSKYRASTVEGLRQLIRDASGGGAAAPSGGGAAAKKPRKASRKKVEPPPAGSDDLAGMNITALKALARREGISGYSKYRASTVEGLRQLIRDARGGGTTAPSGGGAAAPASKTANKAVVSGPSQAEMAAKKRQRELEAQEKTKRMEERAKQREADKAARNKNEEAWVERATIHLQKAHDDLIGLIKENPDALKDLDLDLDPSAWGYSVATKINYNVPVYEILNRMSAIAKECYNDANCPKYIRDFCTKGKLFPNPGSSCNAYAGDWYCGAKRKLNMEHINKFIRDCESLLIRLGGELDIVTLDHGKRLIEENESLRAQVAEIEAAAAAAAGEMEDLKTQIQSLTDENADLKSTVEMVGADLEARDVELAALKETYDTCKAEHDEALAELENLKEINTTLEEEVTAAGLEAESQQSTIKTLNDELESAQASLKQCEEKH
jgi:hypothetical protein